MCSCCMAMNVLRAFVEAMSRAERKRQFAAFGRRLKPEKDLHPGLAAKWGKADDNEKPPN